MTRNSIFKHEGKAKVIRHNAVFGVLETEVREVTVGEPMGFAQWDRAVNVSYTEPRKRRGAYCEIVPDNLKYITIEVDGKTVFDTRTVIDCDMTKWQEVRDRTPAVQVVEAAKPKPPTPEERQQERERCESHWRKFNDFLAENASTFEAFRQPISELFAARAADRDNQFSRRPPWSMRIPADGEPTAFLAVRPRFRAGTRSKPGSLMTESLEVELMTARLRANKDVLACEWGVIISPSETRAFRSVYVGFDEANAKAIATVKDFLADPRKIIAKSSGNCCLCGRPLTDEQSRNRGVGPECLQYLNWLVGSTAVRPVRQTQEDSPSTIAETFQGFDSTGKKQADLFSMAGA